jgi:hypothetical protein
MTIKMHEQAGRPRSDEHERQPAEITPPDVAQPWTARVAMVEASNGGSARPIS